MGDARAPRALVADVGGTNCRLGIAQGGAVLPDTVRRFANDDFPDFAAVARAFLGGQRVEALAVAIAGPVTDRAGRLTNRDWHFDTAALSAALDIPVVRLLNDVAALGRALPVLPPTAMEQLRQPQGGDSRNAQALVVNLGTGFNVSPVAMDTGKVFEAELGHGSLPASVVGVLADRVDAASFTSVERLFSGHGLRRLHAALGQPDAAPADIVASDGTTLAILARALGAFVRELAYLYLPDAGFYFNGSIARALLAPAHRETVFAPLAGDDSFDGRIARIPAFLLTEDSAALHGCAQVVAEAVVTGLNPVAAPRRIVAD